MSNPVPLKEWMAWRPHEEVKKLAKSFGIGALGVGAIQINSFLDAIFARWADLSGPVYLWYAIRFQQLALAIFGIAAVNTLVPVLSRVIKKGKEEEGKEVFAFGYRRLLSVMLPCTFAIFALGYPVINLIFGRGDFSPDAVKQTALCLSAYGIGLLPATLIMLLSAVLFAQGNFRTSMFLSLATVGMNCGLNAFFIFGLQLGAASTALATSLSAWCNFLLLRHVLLKKGWSSQIPIPACFHLIFAGGIAAFFAHALIPYMGDSKSLSFCIPALAFIGVLFVYARLFRNSDLMNLFRTYLTRSDHSAA